MCKEWAPFQIPEVRLNLLGGEITVDEVKYDIWN